MLPTRWEAPRRSAGFVRAEGTEAILRSGSLAPAGPIYGRATVIHAKGLCPRQLNVVWPADEGAVLRELTVS